MPVGVHVVALLPHTDRLFEFILKLTKSPAVGRSNAPGTNKQIIFKSKLWHEEIIMKMDYVPSPEPPVGTALYEIIPNMIK